MVFERFATSAFHRPDGCEFYIYADQFADPLLLASARECTEPGITPGHCMRALASGYDAEVTLARLNLFADQHGGDAALQFRAHPHLELLVPALGERILGGCVLAPPDELSIRRTAAAAILDGLMEDRPAQLRHLRRQ